MTKTVSHAHRIVADTARQMCHAAYDALMSRNEWYDLWKSQNPGASARELERRFVVKNASKYIGIARATLAGMLAQPHSDDLKSAIYDALLLDKTLTRGRGRGKQVMN